MSTKNDYIEFIKEQLSGVPEFSYRKMMGDYVIYCKGKVIGGVFDDKLLVKRTVFSDSFIKNPEYVIPYKNAKQMILVDNLEDKDFLNELCDGIADTL